MPGQVGDVERRVGRRLHPDDVRSLRRREDRRGVGDVHRPELERALGRVLGEQAAHPEVAVRRQHDHLGSEGVDHRRRRRHAGGERQRPPALRARRPPPPTPPTSPCRGCGCTRRRRARWTPARAAGSAAPPPRPAARRPPRASPARAVGVQPERQHAASWADRAFASDVVMVGRDRSGVRQVRTDRRRAPVRSARAVDAVRGRARRVAVVARPSSGCGRCGDAEAHAARREWSAGCRCMPGRRPSRRRRVDAAARVGGRGGEPGRSRRRRCISPGRLRHHRRSCGPADGAAVDGPREAHVPPPRSASTPKPTPGCRPRSTPPSPPRRPSPTPDRRRRTGTHPRHRCHGSVPRRRAAVTQVDDSGATGPTRHTERAHAPPSRALPDHPDL